MKKNVWILNHHASNMFFDKNQRHYFFGKYMLEQGYRPIVFCSNARHDGQGLYFDTDKLFVAKKTSIKVPFIFVKGRAYQGNGKGRIMCMLDYLNNMQRIAPIMERKFGKPDIIYASSVHPLALVAGIKLARKYKVKCICEVRDLWPETLVVMGYLKRKSLIARILYRGERWIYKKADALIFTMEGGYDYITDKGWQNVIPKSKVHYVNNGVDLESNKYNSEHYTLTDEDLDNPNTFKILYTGSIRQANGIEKLLDCAEQLQDADKINFLVYGDGNYLGMIKEEVRRRNIQNVILKGEVDNKYVPYILSRGNLNLLNYHAAAAAAGLYKYGSSQNKLFEYLASGKPIISNTETKYSVIDTYHCGVAKNIFNGIDYAEEIKKIVSMSRDEYEAMCRNSLRAAEEYDYRKLTDKVIELIESV